ncbi:MAG TPA: thermonuclease family protein [Casimicrobiaceae bacterium]|nr:thermonuclease family protein [Casimicrobiaceae bacterium]
MTPAPAARRHVARAALALCTVALAAAGSACASLSGRVVAVHDGDTITVLAGRSEVRVRLAGIDAPERGQPHGTAARKALADRVAGRVVRVSERGRDAYGRTLGVVLAGAANVNGEQVRDGWAWVFRRFAHDPAWLDFEDEARRARRGLWRDADPVPPWTWREGEAARRDALSRQPAPAGRSSTFPSARVPPP